MPRKEKKNKLINFVVFLVLFSCLLYFIDNYNNKIKTNVAVVGKLEDKIRLAGVFFSDEAIIKSKTDGEVKFYYDEGDKIKKDILALEIYTDLDSHELDKELSDIDNAIDLLESSGNMMISEESKDNTEEIEINIQNALFNNDIDTLYNIVDNIEKKSEQCFDVSAYDKYTLEELNKLKTSIIDSSNNNKIDYYSNRSGIVSYKFDGLENVYSLKNMYDFTASNLNILDNKIIDVSESFTTSKNQNIMKIINNFEYYILVKIGNNELKNIEEDMYLKTRIIDKENNDLLHAYIEKINYGSEESILIMKFDDYFYKYYDHRYVDIELIRNIYEGIIIDLEAIVEINNQTGVYIKDISKVVKFFPVKIIGQNDKIAVVSEGKKLNEGARGLIYIESNQFYTIKNYDQVILEPDKAFEGQILN